MQKFQTRNVGSIVCPNILLWASYGKPLKRFSGMTIYVQIFCKDWIVSLEWTSYQETKVNARNCFQVDCTSWAAWWSSPSWTAGWSSLRWASWWSYLRWTSWYNKRQKDLCGRKVVQLLLVPGLKDIKIK